MLIGYRVIRGEGEKGANPQGLQQSGTVDYGKLSRWPNDPHLHRKRDGLESAVCPCICAQRACSEPSATPLSPRPSARQAPSCALLSRQQRTVMPAIHAVSPHPRVNTVRVHGQHVLIPPVGAGIPPPPITPTVHSRRPQRGLPVPRPRHLTRASQSMEESNKENLLPENLVRAGAIWEHEAAYPNPMHILPGTPRAAGDTVIVAIENLRISGRGGASPSVRSYEGDEVSSISSTSARRRSQPVQPPLSTTLVNTHRGMARAASPPLVVRQYGRRRVTLDGGYEYFQRGQERSLGDIRTRSERLV